jgi:hypothetical protein
MEMEREKREEQEQGQTDTVSHGQSLQSEVDLSDRDDGHEDHSDDHHDDDHVDYSEYTKQQLVDLIKDLTREENFKLVDNILLEIKQIFDDQRENDRAEALMKFEADVGTAEDF